MSDRESDTSEQQQQEADLSSVRLADAGGSAVTLVLQLDKQTSLSCSQTL